MTNISTQFQKGKSGNPNGAPKKEWSWSGILREVADQKVNGKTKKEWVADSLFAQAIKGNVQAIREIADRLEGKTITIEKQSDEEHMRKEHSKKLYEAIKKAI